MAQSMSRESKREASRFPGLAEILLSLFCSILVAADLRNQGNQNRFSGVSYYFETPGVDTLQRAGLVIALSILGTTLAWILFKWFALWAKWMLRILVIAGATACWWELFVAVQSLQDAKFVLEGLPYRPVNNQGLLGAQIFLGYLMFTVPTAVRRPVIAFLVKLGLAICLAILQLLMWTLLSQPLPAPAG